MRKRKGHLERIDREKLLRSVTSCCQELSGVEPDRIITKVLSSLQDGTSTTELTKLLIQTAASLTAEEPDYSQLATRLLLTSIHKEVANQKILSFLDSITMAYESGLLHERMLTRAREYASVFEETIRDCPPSPFDYIGLQTIYDRYLLRHPTEHHVVETPSYFWMRIAVALSRSTEEALQLFHLFASLEYLPSSPTLFNAGTRHEQLSSCFLLDSPEDSLESIYQRYTEIALLSKFSGGIGIAYHRVRAQGSRIESTNGRSSGIIPWLKTLDSSVAAVNQGGRRKGACCVYLEPWHMDIDDFLELRDNTGDEARRTHNLHIAHWIPDLFMKRVEEDQLWSLFDPKTVPHFPDLYGESFKQAYEAAEQAGLAVKTVKARQLYGRMMRMLAQTGNGWMNFKDTCNRTCNQTAKPGRVLHSSNLCTEILEVTSSGEVAVCNLGSINLGRHTKQNSQGHIVLDEDKLRYTITTAVRQLNRVIDLTFYPIPTASASNQRWRPIGLGWMGLHDLFLQMRLPFDSPEAQELSTHIAEEIYFHALSTSCDLAEQEGAHPAFSETRAAQGKLQFDSWGVQPKNMDRWIQLKQRIQTVGLRNSLLIAIAPTATISSIAGCSECIEPRVSNLFKRETLSGDFLQMNRYLVEALKSLNLWNKSIRHQIKAADGSIQSIEEIPAATRKLFRTAWELPMRPLIDMAAARGAFIDQSQSLNLFMESPTLDQLSSMYMYAWKKGIKTTYYLRSRPATRIAKTTVEGALKTGVQALGIRNGNSSHSPTACALENPETCEACQ
ncbi:ribonucleoside-diphosphate reductase subunit alpha [Pajaroellobacter abortibovis]|uniref:Ribonucleoside-diphosphate reductase n=1 Tax=Pajaroellobacter abortibovis TaxID=1882918 RepID=A0A1L6MZH4_9BACT|nr:ribonucleoside-diphosphate reductase subunit alpha [Pajaroellobacter abortibovis]